MKQKKYGRILALILVIAMLMGACAQLFAMIAYADEPTDVEVDRVTRGSTSNVYIPGSTQATTIVISYSEPVGAFTGSVQEGQTITADGFEFADRTWRTQGGTNKSTLVFKVGNTYNNGERRNVTATISNVLFYGGVNDRDMELTGIKIPNDIYDIKKLGFTFPESYFTRPGSSSDDESPIVPDIVIESVSVYDREGKLMDTVTKESPPFSVEIIYSDYGMVDVDVDDIEKDKLEVYALDFGGFVPQGGVRGRLTNILTLSRNDALRFKIVFNNLTYDGGGSTINFRVQYDVNGELVNAEKSARVYQATTTEDEEKDELPPPTPYIIVSQYSYGSNDIVAGNSFSLNLSYQNTSSDIALENIIMTVTTPEDLSIASASNTVYVASLGAGASLNHTVELQARPNAAVGSHSVQVDFAYQYVWDKERKDGKTTESIAIPITQIDRFELDPITEMSTWTQVGDQFYVTISFINRGKSPTYNITATARSNLGMLVINEHYGNLEAGKADSVDVTIIPNEGGDMVGEIAVQYEDENNNPKELTMPFTIYVDTPWDPSMDPDWNPDPGMGEEEEEEVRHNTASTVLYVIGGALMTFALAFYVMQRVKSKESDGFDEDF